MSKSGGDMIVPITFLPGYTLPEGVKLKRAFPADKEKILSFVEENFGKGWRGETEKAIFQNPSSCFIATRDTELLGFACYDSSAKGFFGPTGVRKDLRGQGLGGALLIRTLEAMREAGYAYGIIGWVGDAKEFYEKTVGAVYIPGGGPENSVYSNMIMMK